MNTCHNCGGVYATKHEACPAIRSHIQWRTEELKEYQAKKRPLYQAERERVELLKQEIQQLQQM
jgi:hypothetical protein